MSWLRPTEFPVIPNNAEIAVDTETYCEDLSKKGPQFITGSDYPIGISMAFEGYRQYFPFAHKTGNLNMDVVGYFKELLAREDLIVIGANTKFDLESLWKAKIFIKGKIIDIQVQEALIDENQYTYSLNNIAKRRGFPEKTSQPMEEWMVRHGLVLRGKPDYSRLPEVPPEIVGPYAADDAGLTFDIYQRQKADLAKDDMVEVAKLESDLIPVLWLMRLRGVKVDVNLAEIQSERIKTFLKQEWKRFPLELDPWSSASVGKWISDCYNLAIPQTSKDKDSITNDWLKSTGIDDLKHLAEWRQADKIRRDFIESVIIEGSHKGRLHPQWFQSRGSSFMSADEISGTRSGRIACTDPNLTQIPRRHPKWGPIIRSLFIPEVNCKWYKGDYSSQEPRITVHYAYLLKLPGAAEVRQMYIDNPASDFHQKVTDMVNRVRKEPITRDQGKTINLGLAYGMGVKKLATSLGLPLDQTKDILETYHGQVPFMRELLARCADIAVQRGFVRTILGRRRRFNEWENAAWGEAWSKPLPMEEAQTKWPRIRRAGTYKAVNSVIQGSAADQTKTALLLMHNEGLPPRIQVYDEISASVESDRDGARIKEIMEHAIKFEVPHLVDAKVGPNWAMAEIK